MTRFPLFFTFNEYVFGSGFLANVTARGRVLAVDEGEDGWWVYGVQPGSLAAGGDTINAALKAFRKNFKNVLLDLSHENCDFSTFDRAAQEMFAEVNAAMEQEWRSAVEAVRNGTINPENIRREDADSECSITVQAKEQALLNPTDNYQVRKEAVLAA